MILGPSGRYLPPKLTTDTLRFSDFKDALPGNFDLINGETWTSVGVSSAIAVDSPTGRALSYSSDVSITSPQTASEITSLASDNWTIQIMVRFMADTAGAITNILSLESTSGRWFSLGYQDRQIQWGWTGPSSNLTGVFTKPEVLNGEWYTLTLHYDGTDLTLGINGRYDQKFTSLTPPDGAPTGNWILGQDTASVLGVSSGSVSRDAAPMELDYVLFRDGEYTAAEMRENHKRLVLGDKPTTICAKLEVERYTGTTSGSPATLDKEWIDLTDYKGLDWLKSFKLTDNNNAPVVKLDVDLFKESRFCSLAPLRGDSSANLFDANDPSTLSEISSLLNINLGIRICYARLPQGINVRDGDWQLWFNGKIDTIDFGNETIKIQARDLGSVLVDAYIEEEGYYSFPGPDSLQDVSKAIIDQNSSDNYAGTYDKADFVIKDPMSLLVLVRPAYEQRREPILSALRTLAGSAAADTRFKLDPITGDFCLTLYQPQRAKTYPDIVLCPDQIIDFNRASIDIKDVRNVGRLTWRDASSSLTTPVSSTARAYAIRHYGVSSEDLRLNATLEATDITSLIKYGRRFFEIVEASTSPIDTIDEARVMLDALLNDFSEPDFSHNVKVCLMPEIRVDDMIAMLPNRAGYSGEQILAVASVTHNYGEQGSTDIQMRGKPSLSPKRWKNIVAHPTKGKPPLLDPDSTKFDFENTGLQHVVRNVYDRTLNLNASRLRSNRNPEFQEWTRGPFYPPDGWNTDPFTNEVENITDDNGVVSIANNWTASFEKASGDTGSGDGAVEWLSADGVLISDFVEIGSQKDESLGVELTYKSLGAGTSYPKVIVEYYDQSRTLLGAALHSPHESLHRGSGGDLFTTPVPSQVSFTTTGSHSLLNGEYYDIFPYPSYGGPDTGNFFPSDVQLRKLLVDNSPTGIGSESVTANAPFTTGLSGWGAPGGFLSLGWHLRPRYWDVDASSPSTEWATRRMLGIEWVDRAARFVRVRVEHAGAFSGMVLDKVLVYELAASVGAELHDKNHHTAHGIFIDDTHPVEPTTPPYAWTGVHASHPLVAPADQGEWEAFPFIHCGDERVGFDYGDVFVEQAGLITPAPTYPQGGGHFRAKEAGRYEAICILNGLIGHGGPAYSSPTLPPGASPTNSNTGLRQLGVARIRVVRTSGSTGVREVVIEGDTAAPAGISEGFAVYETAGPWDIVANATGTVFLDEGDMLHAEVFFRSDWGAGNTFGGSVEMTLYDKGGSYFRVSLRRVD